MTNFKDKVVWITGASSGIGEALTMAFAKEGAKLVLTARRRSPGVGYGGSISARAAKNSKGLSSKPHCPTPMC